MILIDALGLLAHLIGLNANDLIAYAAEDQQGGRWHGFNGWAIDVDEGRLLYALVRALKPVRVLEIGTYEGASACHLLAALEANDSGELASYDTWDRAGNSVPPELHKRWQFNTKDAVEAALPYADLVFEDADHSFDPATATYRKLRALQPRIVIVHDHAMTPAHGDFFVRQAFETVFPEGIGIVLEGCERGLGVWVNAEWQAPVEVKPEAPRKPAPAKGRR